MVSKSLTWYSSDDLLRIFSKFHILQLCAPVCRSFWNLLGHLGDSFIVYTNVWIDLRSLLNYG